MVDWTQITVARLVSLWRYPYECLAASLRDGRNVLNGLLSTGCETGALLCKVTVLMLLFSCVQLGCRADDSLARVQRVGVLRVGYAVEAPYAYINADQQVTGESPETARRIAARMGISRIDWVQVAFESLVPELLQRRFDLVAAGLFITPERQKRVHFSNPTVRVGAGFLMLRGNPKQLTSLTGLESRSDVRLAVLAGSVEQARLKALSPSPGTVIDVPDAQTGRAAVFAGSADALLLSWPTVYAMASASQGALEAHSAIPSRQGGGQSMASSRTGHRPGAQAAEPLTFADQVAFAFHPDDVSLLDAWNQAQNTFVGSPEHLQLVEPFGFAPTDVITTRDAASQP